VKNWIGDTAMTLAAVFATLKHLHCLDKKSKEEVPYYERRSNPTNVRVIQQSILQKGFWGVFCKNAARGPGGGKKFLESSP
jgi:hypothetical protein